MTRRAAGAVTRLDGITVGVGGVADFDALGLRWRDLEQRAAGSFFQSWTWVGCLVAERFPDPILVEVTEGGRTVALALFNRVRRRFGPAVLHLGASGTSELDCPYVEQNGVLSEAGRETELTAFCLHTVASRYDLSLPGIDEPGLMTLRRVARLVRVTRSQPSPFVDLAALRLSGQDYLGSRSANTRQQIRRSDRLYERRGTIAVELAGTVAAGHAMLDEMAELHQAAWGARGRPGAFARPFFGRFHHALIATALPRGEAVLIKVTCNTTTIGIVYNFLFRRRMLSYQSGFAYDGRDSHAKPGLTCHARAIEVALRDGDDVYDFLAGDDRYKRSLADSAHQQVWAESGPLWSPCQLAHAIWEAMRGR